MLEGGRVLAVFFLVFLLTETGVQIVGQLTGWCKPAAGAGQPTQHTTLQYQGQQDQKVDNKAVLGTIFQVDNKAVLGIIFHVDNKAVLGTIFQVDNKAVLGTIFQVDNKAVLGLYFRLITRQF
ncbi:uncharacterized protein LOC111704289 isoform X2 [Eurytemora carolleeae]|uniref:uncharacterized protein LOC111704289 isoform X2 n=1 Tax=Eurytemora carolleeae TaxID=1294199 RepID=UPI000C791EEA|nr:uncharacterized protein LOC111704289 isoform X2 [Eurytemora carolleeae]|eukprot:XP_023332267.1 uncharacterized protein LOC111704289 isoform X2 [Eurytemora affinis]